MNRGPGQCDIGVAKCEFLVQMVGGIINAFRPHRETYLHWGSGQGPGHVEEGQDWSLLYLSRMIKDYTLVVGKYDASEGIEFRIMDPTCSLPLDALFGR